MKGMKEPFSPAASPPPSLAPGLYLVATPIGNLRDITLRALDVLAAVDRVACEDSRLTARLLKTYGLKKQMTVYNDHTDERDRALLLKDLEAGARVALVSDAGTPLVSDPGYKLVQACLNVGVPVTTLPGANAVLSALQLSGLPCDRFSFGGFLPPRSAARRTALKAWATVSGSLIFYETSSRLTDSLSDMIHVLGNRHAAVVREITKLFEETRRGSLESLLAYYTENGAPKGEIVLVLGSPDPEHLDFSDEDLDALLRAESAGHSLRDAVDRVCAQTGTPRKTVYARALKLFKDSSDVP